MKKRGLAGLLALALILALGACGGTEAQEDAAQDQKMEEAAPPQEEETSETDGEDGVPVTIEGPETADDSQQLQEDEPDLGSRPADPAKEPETGSRPADPAEKPIYQPVEDTKPQQPDKEPETPAQPAPAPPAESASGVDLRRPLPCSPTLPPGPVPPERWPWRVRRWIRSMRDSPPSPPSSVWCRWP